jgi:hypothetical protein
VVSTSANNSNVPFDISRPLLLPPTIATVYMTLENRCYYGARGMCMGATSAHSSDGSSNISGPFLLSPTVATGYMTSEDHCYYGAHGTRVGATSMHNSDGPSNIVAMGVLTLVDCWYWPPQ